MDICNVNTYCLIAFQKHYAGFHSCQQCIFTFPKTLNFKLFASLIVGGKKTLIHVYLFNLHSPITSEVEHIFI